MDSNRKLMKEQNLRIMYGGNPKEEVMAKASAKKISTKSKGKAAEAKTEVLVVWGKVKKLTDKRVSKEVKFVLSDLIRKIIKNAGELAESDGMETIKGRHAEDAVKAQSGNSSAASEDAEKEE